MRVNLHRQNRFHNRKPSRAGKRATEKTNGKWPSELDVIRLDEDIKKSNKRRVRCRFCGKLDNDWPSRRGLCVECYCEAVNRIPADWEEDRQQIFEAMSEAEVMSLKPVKKWWVNGGKGGKDGGK